MKLLPSDKASLKQGLRGLSKNDCQYTQSPDNISSCWSMHSKGVFVWESQEVDWN